MIYQSINPAVYRRVPADVGRLLDIGCGGGAFGSAVKRATPCTVVGVTYGKINAKVAAYMFLTLSFTCLFVPAIGLMGYGKLPF